MVLFLHFDNDFLQIVCRIPTIALPLHPFSETTLTDNKNIIRIMKKYIFTIVAAALLTACQTDLIDEHTPSANETTAAAATRSAAVESVSQQYPQADGAEALSHTPAEAAWQILGRIDTQRALQMGETHVADGQMAEIKAFVDANLKADNDYDTYRNIFMWISKNMTYASSGDAYLDAYDVFTHKRCICQGYANLLKTMCISQGIPALIANGWLSTIGGHAWNYVYADGKWLVSDPTNGTEYAAENTAAYKDLLIPQRFDLTVFEDQAFAYNFQDGELNVCEVKPTIEGRVAVPWSVAGLCITSFRPTTELPAAVSQLCLGSNIRSLGTDPFSLCALTKSLKEILVDPSSPHFSAYKGVVYQKGSTAPYLIPGGITRLELCSMDVIDKNTIAWLDDLEEIVVADGTQRIEAYAVESCPRLRKVYVPKSVTYVDKDAFYRCGDVEVEFIAQSY